MSTRPVGAFRSPRQEVASQAWGGGYSAGRVSPPPITLPHRLVVNTAPLAGSAGSSLVSILRPRREPLNDDAGQMLSTTTMPRACPYTWGNQHGLPDTAPQVNQRVIRHAELRADHAAAAA